MDNLTVPIEPLFIVRRVIKEGERTGHNKWWEKPIWYHISKAQDHLICISAGSLNTERSMFDHLAHALCRLWFATYLWMMNKDKRKEFQDTSYIDFRASLKAEESKQDNGKAL